MPAMGSTWRSRRSAGGKKTRAQKERLRHKHARPVVTRFFSWCQALWEGTEGPALLEDTPMYDAIRYGTGTHPPSRQARATGTAPAGTPVTALAAIHEPSDTEVVSDLYLGAVIRHAPSRWPDDEALDAKLGGELGELASCLGIEPPGDGSFSALREAAARELGAVAPSEARARVSSAFLWDAELGAALARDASTVGTRDLGRADLPLLGQQLLAEVDASMTPVPLERFEIDLALVSDAELPSRPSAIWAARLLAEAHEGGLEESPLHRRFGTLGYMMLGRLKDDPAQGIIASARQVAHRTFTGGADEDAFWAGNGLARGIAARGTLEVARYAIVAPRPWLPAPTTEPFPSRAHG